MAAITLKDLMDPLVKIAAATEETAQKIDAVVAAVAGGPGASLNQEIVKELKTQTNLLKVIAGKSGSLDTGGEKSSGKSGTLKEAGNTLVALGAGAKELAMGLIIFRFVPKKGVETFISVITELFELYDKNKPNEKNVQETAESINLIGSSIYNLGIALAKSFLTFIVGYLAARLFLVTINILLPTFELIGDNESIQKGADTLDVMGGALNKFAKGLVLAAIGSVIGVLFTPVIALAMIILGGAFALLGLADKPIRKGAKATRMMGNALVWFAVGLATAALVSIVILMEPKILLAMVGSLILIGGAMALLGLVAGPIRKGAVALALVGVSLAIFSVGYLIFSAVASDITLEDIGTQLLLLVGIGGIFALAGLGIKFIALGALSFIAIGIGLAVFSLGYLPFALVTKDMTMDDVALQAGLLGGIALEFAAAGFGSLFILAGAGAFAAVGIALLLLTPGLLAIKKVNFTQEDSVELATMLAGVKSAFLGGKDADEGFFSKIGGAITGAIDSVKMIEAAAGFAAAGLALQRLSKGLIAFKSVGWNDELSKELVTMLNGITTAFALAGSSEQVPSSSFFGQIFGFNRTAVEEGISSVMGAGKALTSITKGLISFQKLIDSGVKFGQPDNEGRYQEGTLGYAVTNTIGFINQAFAAVGEQGNVDGGGFFDTLLDIKRNKVAEGISSVQGAGKALTKIAEGLQSFQDFINKGVKFGQPDADGNYEEGTLGYAVTNTIGFINQAFAAVAEQGNVEAGGFFGSLFGIKKNKVAEGIESVKGAGKELTNIATGLMTFQDLIEKEVDWDKLGEAITKSLGFVSDAFASIGGNEESDGWFIYKWDENLVAKGVKAVKGAGTELTNIATGLKTFQDLIDKEVDFNKLGESIKKSLTFVGDAFATIGGKEQQDSTLFGLIKWDENLVAKGIKNVKGAGQELTNITKGLQSFADLKNPKAIANSIKQIFTSIGGTFTFYYKKPKFKSQLDHMKGFITEISDNAKKGYIHKAAEGMNNIAKAVNSIDKNKAEAFANLFKGAGELTNNQQAFSALVKAVEQIRDVLSRQSSPANAGGVVEGIKNLFKPSDAQPQQTGGELGPVLNNINASLSRLNGTMSSLPAQIQAIKIVVPEN